MKADFWGPGRSSELVFSGEAGLWGRNIRGSNRGARITGAQHSDRVSRRSCSSSGLGRWRLVARRGVIAAGGEGPPSLPLPVSTAPLSLARPAHKAQSIARHRGAFVLGKEMVLCLSHVCDCRLGSPRRDGSQT